MKNLFLALRKVLFWAHLVAGVVAGLVILVMAGTGTLLSFERQITDAANGYHPGPATPGAAKLGPEELIAKLKEAAPETAPSAMTFRSGTDEPTSFQFGREKTLYVDPYTGAVLGEGAKKTRGFFQFVTGLHRWLAMQGTARDVGQGITSAAALVFVFILVSGLYLWIPKRWTRKGVKVITTFQRGTKGRARDWNWHNVLGIWFALPLLVLSTTGVIMAYPWANKLLFGLVGETPPERRPEGGGGPGGGGGGAGGEQRPGAPQGPAQGEGRPRGEGRPGGPEGSIAGAEGAEGERPRGEGRRRREGGGEGDLAGSEGQGDGGERSRGEGRRRREGGAGEGGDFAGRGEQAGGEGQAEGGERPRGEGRRRREGGGGEGMAGAASGGGEGGGQARREGGGGGGGRGPQAPAVWPVSTQGWNAAFAVAEAASKDWQTIQFQMPRGNEATFAVSDSHRGRPDLRQSVTVSLASGEVTKVEKFDSQSKGRQLRNWVRWIHTGEAGGWAGQIVAMLSTLAAVMLVWTGLALSWRRFFKKRKVVKVAVAE